MAAAMEIDWRGERTEDQIGPDRGLLQPTKNPAYFLLPNHRTVTKPFSTMLLICLQLALSSVGLQLLLSRCESSWRHSLRHTPRWAAADDDAIYVWFIIKLMHNVITTSFSGVE